MEDNFRSIINEIIEEFNKEILLDGKRFYSIFADKAPFMDREKKIIKRLNQEGLLQEIHKQLLDNSDSSKRLEMLLDDSGFSKDWKITVLQAFGFSYIESIDEIDNREEDVEKYDSSIINIIENNDSKITLFCASNSITANYCDEIKAVCYAQKKNIKEYIKSHQGEIPKVNNRTNVINGLLKRIKIYQAMFDIDNGISIFKYNNQRELLNYCEKQRENIKFCYDNNYPLPKLTNDNLEEIEEIYKKKRKGKIKKFFFVFLSVVAIACIVGVVINRYKADFPQIPFGPIEVKGKNIDDVYYAFIDEGFDNVIKKPKSSGIQKGGIVSGVIIGDSTRYKKGDTPKQDVKIEISYFSEDRISLTDDLHDWKKEEYTQLRDILTSKGINNISYKTKVTVEEKQKNLVSSLKINDISYTSGECYIPQDAPIVIEYYIWKIKIGSKSSELQDKKYSTVVSDLKKKGFTNIRLQRSDDLITGWVNKPGTVKSISVDGKRSFNADTLFDPNSQVTIVVNTYKGKGYKDITEIAK